MEVNVRYTGNFSHLEPKLNSCHKVIAASCRDRYKHAALTEIDTWFTEQLHIIYVPLANCFATELTSFLAFSNCFSARALFNSSTSISRNYVTMNRIRMIKQSNHTCVYTMQFPLPSPPPHHPPSIP